MKINYLIEKNRIRLNTSLPDGRFRYYLDEVDPSDWDKKRQRSKKNHSLNKFLNRLAEKCLEARRDLINNGKYTRVNFKAELDSYLGKSASGQTLIQYVKVVQSRRKKNPTYSANYFHTFEMLINNLKIFGDIPMQSMKPSYVVDFNSFILNKGYSISSCKIMHRLIKVALNEAFNDDLITIDPRRFKVKFGRNELLQPRLTLQEIELLRNANLVGLLDFIRNEFLLGIYTGARFSDWSKFSKANFYGEKFIYESKKTGQPVTLGLSDLIRDLVLKLESQRIEFRLVSENANYQRFLKYVKIVCQKAEINSEFKRKEKGEDVVYEKWQLIKSHTARRTFCSLKLEEGLTLRQILPYSGHLSLQSLERYLMASV